MLKEIGFADLIIEYKAPTVRIRLTDAGQYKKATPGQQRFRANKKTIEEKLKYLNLNRNFEKEDSKEGTILLRKGNITVLEGYELEGIDGLFINAAGNLEEISTDLKTAIDAFSKIKEKYVISLRRNT